jgi:hypothetical protein
MKYRTVVRPPLSPQRSQISGDDRCPAPRQSLNALSTRWLSCPVYRVSISSQLPSFNNITEVFFDPFVII